MRVFELMTILLKRQIDPDAILEIEDAEGTRYEVENIIFEHNVGKNESIIFSIG